MSPNHKLIILHLTRRGILSLMINANARSIIRNATRRTKISRITLRLRSFDSNRTHGPTVPSQRTTQSSSQTIIPPILKLVQQSRSRNRRAYCRNRSTDDGRYKSSRTKNRSPDRRGRQPTRYAPPNRSASRIRSKRKEEFKQRRNILKVKPRQCENAQQ